MTSSGCTVIEAVVNGLLPIRCSLTSDSVSDRTFALTVAETGVAALPKSSTAVAVAVLLRGEGSLDVTRCEQVQVALVPGSSLPPAVRPLTAVRVPELQSP